MTASERRDRIAAMQLEVDLLIADCTDGDCSTYDALEDVASALVAARSCASRDAEPERMVA